MLLFLPDFSDRGKRRARKSWIRPQNTVFWDLDSLLKRSARGRGVSLIVTSFKYPSLFNEQEFHMIFTIAHPQQVVLPSRIKGVLGGRRDGYDQIIWFMLGKQLRGCSSFTDFQVETLSSTKEKILSHWSRGRQSSTSPSRMKGVVAEQIPAKRRDTKLGKGSFTIMWLQYSASVTCVF